MTTSNDKLPSWARVGVRVRHIVHDGSNCFGREGYIEKLPTASSSHNGSVLYTTPYQTPHGISIKYFNECFERIIKTNCAVCQNKL